MVILGDGLSDSDVGSVVSAYAGVEGTLIVSLCARQSVPLANGVMYVVCVCVCACVCVCVVLGWVEASSPGSLRVPRSRHHQQ